MDQPRTMRSGWVARIRRFARGADAPARCEMCGAPIAHAHRHLLEPAARRVLCACAACALLLGARDDARYRVVPDVVDALPGFRLDDAQWDALRIPIGIAFFYRSSPQQGRVVAMYPGPAGATESLLPLDAWDELERDNPVLRSFAPDVEALLVNRVGDAREHYRVPIDRCYALVGLIRTRWQGVSGGRAAWDAIHGFFARLAAGEDALEPLHA